MNCSANFGPSVGEFEVHFNPTDITVRQGSTGSVQIVLVRPIDLMDVHLSVTQCPVGVRCTLSSDVMPPSSPPATLTFEPFDSALGALRVRIHAEGERTNHAILSDDDEMILRVE